MPASSHGTAAHHGPPSRGFKYAAPQSFFPIAGKLIPWFAWSAALLTLVGLYVGVFAAPTDHQQGDAYRIIFLHVPAAWMSMLIYLGYP